RRDDQHTGHHEAGREPDYKPGQEAADAGACRRDLEQRRGKHHRVVVVPDAGDQSRFEPKDANVTDPPAKGGGLHAASSMKTQKIVVRVDGRIFPAHCDPAGNPLRISERKVFATGTSMECFYNDPYWSSKRHADVQRGA